ncbi:hypothetical protein Val02_68170 [Virgisporangium aliadipatigenens]|uniref:Uncharacterized protein n=1 Tax=Virgisporangium aliadipatigenens TaxID=741659 RepID=A0A8J4DU37_9ACTN|nr:hypothetical protein Val02_68170 [Virgisporangium aliadipatigenens]
MRSNGQLLFADIYQSGPPSGYGSDAIQATAQVGEVFTSGPPGLGPGWFNAPTPEEDATGPTVVARGPSGRVTAGAGQS